MHARRCSRQIDETIRANKELVTVYDKAIQNFENTCAQVIKSEIKRINDEKALEEAIRANHGKADLEFFQDPELETVKRIDTYKQRNKCVSGKNSRTVTPKRKLENDKEFTLWKH